MINLFAVIGEHDSDPDRLLVVGEDGRHYAWELTTDETVPVEVDDGWRLDDNLPERGILFEEQMGL